MPDEFTSPTAVALPARCGVLQTFTSVNLADAFTIRLPAAASSNPDELARFIFAQQPGWVTALLSLRDLIMRGFGVKTASSLAKLADKAGRSRVGIFKVYSNGADEIVIGEDDSHLDFRISLLCSRGPLLESRHLTMSTVVQCHNLLGRCYLFVIAPFHRVIVKASLRRAAQIGWP